MMFIDNAAALWMAPSGVIPGGVSFEPIPANSGWMIVGALLAVICAILWFVTQPARSAVAARRKLRLVGTTIKRRPRPQHA